MADSQLDWPEEERILRAMIRSLKACLILTRERAETIATQSFDSYRTDFEFDGYEDPDSAAHDRFDLDVDRAEEVLAWRAVIVAHLVGGAMSRYAGARTPLDDPWMAWKNEPPDEPAGTFVHSLSEEELFCARVAYHIHAGPNVSNYRSISVPSDGDLQDIPGYLETEYARWWDHWLGVLGDIGELTVLYSAISAAKRDLDQERPAQDAEVERRILELTDQVKAFQMPTIERLDSIGAKVDALGAPNRFRAEEILKDALGAEIYSSLCDDARTAALDAERRFRDKETLDWNSVTAELAKAFEIQVKQRFVGQLAEFLRQSGIRVFPDNEPLPGPGERRRRPIIKDGQAVPWFSLGEIEKALGSPLPQLQDFGRVYGLDLAALEKRIQEVSVHRNRAAHETRMSFANAWSLRDRWLGVTTRDGGIFGALLPKHT